MPPKFSLQPVLDYRHNRVEILEVELGSLLQAQRRGQTLLDSLVDGRGRIMDQLRDQQKGEIDLFMIARLKSSLVAVDERIVEQKERLRLVAEKVYQKRLEVISAKQDDEALQTLKRKEVERYVAEEARKEIHMQDDIYISRAYRRTNGLA